MAWIVTWYLLTAAVVVLVSELAKRSDKLGGETLLRLRERDVDGRPGAAAALLLEGVPVVAGERDGEAGDGLEDPHVQRGHLLAEHRLGGDGDVDDLGARRAGQQADRERHPALHSRTFGR